MYRALVEHVLGCTASLGLLLWGSDRSGWESSRRWAAGPVGGV